MRDDLKLAGFAVALGFTLGTSKMGHEFGPGVFDARGVPHDGLQFERKGVHVWDTARGWRVAALVGDRFEPQAPEQFHGANLHKALLAAVERGDSLPQPAPVAIKCAGCGNDGSEGGLFLTIDARRDNAAGVWIMDERDPGDGGGELDCLACDHRTPIYSAASRFPYGLQVPDQVEG